MIMKIKPEISVTTVSSATTKHMILIHASFLHTICSVPTLLLYIQYSFQFTHLKRHIIPPHTFRRFSVFIVD